MVKVINHIAKWIMIYGGNVLKYIKWFLGKDNVRFISLLIGKRIYLIYFFRGRWIIIICNFCSKTVSCNGLKSVLEYNNDFVILLIPLSTLIEESWEYLIDHRPLTSARNLSKCVCNVFSCKDNKDNNSGHEINTIAYEYDKWAVPELLECYNGHIVVVDTIQINGFL